MEDKQITYEKENIWHYDQKEKWFGKELTSYKNFDDREIFLAYHHYHKEPCGNVGDEINNINIYKKIDDEGYCIFIKYLQIKEHVFCTSFPSLVELLPQMILLLKSTYETQYLIDDE